MSETENNEFAINNTAMRRGRRLRLAAAAGALSIGLAACASSHVSSSGHAVVTVAVLSSFTGADTGYGQEGMSGCIPAVNLINAAGGVLHHKLSCQAYDDRSDPADAVPEVHKILASTPLLLMTFGSGGNTAPAVVPLFNAAKVTIFSETGQSLFNVNHYSYYWRDVPVDASQGFAMAIATRMLGYSHPAAVFGQNVSSQGSLPSFVQGMKLLGHPVADTVLLPTGAPSYATQVAAVQSAHADAIVGEVDPGSAATFMSEVKQVFGHLPPLVGDQAADEAPFLKAVGGAVGGSTLRQRLTLVLPVASSTGPGYQAFRKALLSSSTPSKTTYVTDSYSAADYDAVILTALAADEAKSLASANYERYILPIANGVPGAVVVHTYAQAVAALAKGEKIHYVGASGPINFDRYHNWEPGYVITQLTPGGVKDLKLVPNSILRKLEVGQHASVG
jgi:ABC-type branched-subunit amino acid transport system substrate-binding protein